MATIRREQLAAVNINYRMYPFQDFLDTQRELGMKTIELWAGAPHFLMDYQQRPDCAALRAEIESRPSPRNPPSISSPSPPTTKRCKSWQFPITPTP